MLLIDGALTTARLSKTMDGMLLVSVTRGRSVAPLGI